MPPSLCSPGPDVHVISGRCSILPFCPLLQEFAERCGQAACMHGLPYFLEEEDLSGKHAFLVLRVQPRADVRALSVRHLLGAALLFEYRAFGRRTGALVAQDLEGLRSVIAPRADREEMAATAAEALLNHGAHLVLLSFAGEAAGPDPVPRPTNSTRVLGKRRVHVTARKRSVETSLKMQPTYTATLASLGKSTRFNLGYYRRRLIAAHGCEFVPNAANWLERSERDAFNAASLNPMASERFHRAWQATATLPGGFVCGLRTAAGQWLSFIGGWRQGGTTLLQWQCNAAGFEKFSLTTAMRSYFLEREIESGAKSLVIAGGTPHSLQHSFEKDAVTDLLIRRRTVRATLLAAIAGGLMSYSNAQRSRSSFLGDMLFNAEPAPAGSGPAGRQPTLAMRLTAYFLRRVLGVLQAGAVGQGI